ncbi:MAG: DUF2281 domain-containing protein [Deltaproteobacteria bacterium]|nr:MAG: DUF2281 domain-containing protein [Deltaproteobacteria bacterium]TMQ19143.1 MAG: DUF2281 domain-containing protein [Deltaproteobacteria bacterium]
MAEALRFRTVVSGKTLTISDLGRFEGKRVEVIILDDDSMDAAAPGVVQSKPVRRFGTMAGKIKIADDFDAPLPPDIERAFDGDTE